MADAWIQRVTVESQTEPGKTYVVARKADGSMGCSCPKWVFQGKPRRDCKHIIALLKHIPEWGRCATVKATPKQLREAKVRRETKTVGGYIFTPRSASLAPLMSHPWPPPSGATLKTANKAGCLRFYYN